MSNKTQLQTNNTTLDGYITRINAAKEVAASLPDAGSGSGGASIDTCTVTVTCQQGYIASLVTTVKDGDNGVPYYYAPIVPSETSLTVENVVCGSPIVLQIANLSIVGNNVGGGAEFITVLYTTNNRLFKAPTEAGAVGTISIYDND